MQIPIFASNIDLAIEQKKKKKKISSKIPSLIVFKQKKKIDL